MKFLENKIILVIICVGALVAAIVPSVYFYQKYQKTQVRTVDEAKKAIGKLMVLPEGEEPTLATIADITKLEGQPFFSKAQNGDQILIYMTSRKAILYRPSLGKIIDVGPLAILPTPTP